MEASTQRRKAGLDEKIPDLQRSLNTVRFLKMRKVVACSALANDILLIGYDSRNPTP